MFYAATTKIRRIEFDADINGPVRFETDDGSFVIERKNFYAAFDYDWIAELTPGTTIVVWTVQGSRLAGLEYLKPVENTWIAVWFVGNHFDTKEEAEKKRNAYVKFIEDEAAKITRMIDEGATLKQIHDALEDGHTSNTVGMAFGKGIADATNKANADIIRQGFNDMFGVSELQAKGGTVNPAIFEINKDK